MDKTKLLTLSRALLEIKEKEEEIKSSRILLEGKIALLIPTEDSGQKTVTLDDGSKVTVKRGLIYKADVQDIRGVFSDEFIRKELPVPISVKVEEKLDVKGYEWYRENHPKIFNELAEFVTVTPKKVAITLKMKG